MLSVRLPLAVGTLLVALIAAAPAAAAPGDLDPSFANGGVHQEESFPREGPPAGAILAMPGGRTLVGGWQASAAGVLPFSPAGFPGPMTAIVGGTNYDAPSVGLVRAPKRRLIFAAVTRTSAGINGEVTLARLNRRRELDQSFGGDGLVRTALTPYPWTGVALAMAPGGRIVVASEGPSSAGIQVARFRPNGSPDRRFGDRGVSALAGGRFAEVNDIAVKPDGRTLVTGTANTVSDSDPVVIRLRRNGALDRRFGAGGIVRLPGSGWPSTASAVALLDRGRAAVVGARDYPSRALLAILDRRGRMVGEATLDDTGQSPTGLLDVTVNPDGNLAAAGYVGTDAAVALFTPDGEPVAGFGDSGVATTNLGGTGGEWEAIASQPDGKLVVAGARIEGGYRYISYELAVARYLAE